MSDRATPYFRRRDDLHDRHLSMILGPRTVPADAVWGFPNAYALPDAPKGSPRAPLEQLVLVPVLERYVEAARAAMGKRPPVDPLMPLLPSAPSPKVR